MTIDIETRERARELFVIDGLTIKEVSGEVKVPERTIELWSASDGWVDQRREHRQAIADIKRNSLLLKKKLISKALRSIEGLETIDPQDMHGFRSILAASELKEKTETHVTVDRPRIFLEDLEFLAETLKEIDPEGLKVLGRHFEEVVRRFKERDNAKGRA